MIKRSMHVALHDISVDIKQNYKTTRSYDEDLKQMDIWVVMPHFLLTKQVRHLNKILGVRGLNHLGNKKGYCKKNRNKFIIIKSNKNGNRKSNRDICKMYSLLSKGL